MSKFIRCRFETIQIFGREHFNPPVNLDYCKSIKKFQYGEYPDNDGYPMIKFYNTDVEWVYKEEAERDAAFEEIADNMYEG